MPYDNKDSGRAFAFKPDEPDLYLVGTGVNKKMFFSLCPPAPGQALYKYMVGTDINMDIIAYHWLMV